MAKMEKLQCRVAFRQEGNMWNCYVMNVGDDMGAVLMGSIGLGLAQIPEFNAKFKELMLESFTHMIDDIYGVEPEIGDEIPSTSPRTGHG
jgi:hypothetical protein